MPKQLGFDLYALTVHYRDGDTCVCYARKTANWYYFSDKMDFRIQLAGDNHTITKQEWRRKHYDSSWYESGLLDYVDLMTFGEQYLQSELNPMRGNISNNHTDIVNNYNEFIDTRNEFHKVVNAESDSDYVYKMRLILYNLSSQMTLMNEYYKDALQKLVDNYNDLVEAISQITINLVISENKSRQVDSKKVILHTYDNQEYSEEGFLSDAKIEIPEVESQTAGHILATNPAYYQTFELQLKHLEERAQELSDRVSALGG